MYYHHGDLELANEALYRAQVVDPDYPLAWLGQALVAAGNGHEFDAYSLLTHAITLTPNLVSFANISFAWLFVNENIQYSLTLMLNTEFERSTSRSSRRGEQRMKLTPYPASSLWTVTVPADQMILWGYTYLLSYARGLVTLTWP